jgi:hypothetical protein
MSTYYRTSGWNQSIGEVEVIKETNRFVTLANGDRTSKINGYCKYFPTREEAIQHIENRLAIKVEMLTDELSQVEAQLDNFRVEHGLLMNKT